MSVARTVSVTGGNQTIKKLFFKEGEIMVRFKLIYNSSLMQQKNAKSYGKK